MQIIKERKTKLKSRRPVDGYGVRGPYIAPLDRKLHVKRIDQRQKNQQGADVFDDYVPLTQRCTLGAESESPRM